jgi:IPTL-CTERM motif
VKDPLGKISLATLDAPRGGKVGARNGAPGQLFIVSQANGAASLIGPIREGVNPISITGLAFQPGTGVLYAVSGGGGTDPRSLFTINTANGAATRIGAAGVLQASDINFGPGGVLFAWQQGINQLATVNLATGVPTPLGASGIAGTTGGGLAINAVGTAFLSATGANGTLDTVNTATGAGTTGPALTGAPFTAAMNSMAFNNGGVLFAVNSDTGGPANTTLVTINTTTGAVTNIGALPLNIDGLAFGPAVPTNAVPTLGTWALIAMMFALAGIGVFTMRGK